MYIHIHVILGQCTGGHATVSTGSCLSENTRHQPLYIWTGPDGQLGTLGIQAQILKYTQVAKMYAWNHLAWHLSSCMRVIGKIYGRLQLRTWAESTRKFQGSRVVEEPLQNECRERLKFNIIIVHSIRVITGWIFLFIFLEQGRIFTVNNWLISEVQLWPKCRMQGVFDLKSNEIQWHFCTLRVMSFIDENGACLPYLWSGKSYMYDAPSRSGLSSLAVFTWLFCNWRSL